MKTKAFIFIAALIAATAAFGQSVDGAYTPDGQGNTYQRIDGGTATPQKALSLDGAWQNESGSIVRITGDTGIAAQLSSGEDAATQDAINKGMLKAGGQYMRNLHKTGDLTWTGQHILINFNTSTNAANGVGWGTFTFTLSADGQTFEVGGTTWTRNGN